MVGIEALKHDFLLMCRDTPVYDVTADKVLNHDLAPGAMTSPIYMALPIIILK